MRNPAHLFQGATILGLLALAGCVPPEGGTKPSATNGAVALTQVAYSALPGWQADHQAEALAAFRLSCAHLSDNLGGTGEAASLGGSAASWQPACTAAAKVEASDTAARAFFETWLQPYALAQDGNSSGMFTGYYEPELHGARASGGEFQIPLLAKPNDLVTVDLTAFADDLKGRRITGRIEKASFVPYYDRAEIEKGALHGRRLEFLWLANPVDAFFLQIQGSGRITLADGRVVRVAYAGQNGRPYVPIGRVLADRGQIPLDQVSLQTIRAWLEAHPTDAAAVMNTNPSYVFFREVTGLKPEDGPPGVLGAQLSPGRSVAVDRAFIPLGAPLFIDTTDSLDGHPIQRLMVAQDTGGAIKGAVRADIFYGWGSDAEAHAGKMRAQGRAYVLLPKAQAPH